MSHLATHAQKNMKSGVGRSPKGRARSARFPQEAADVLLRYYHNVSTFPRETERIELAKKVRSVAPRCSHYTAHHVYQYFANLRHKAKNGIQPSLPSDATIPPATSTTLNMSLSEEPTRSAKTESPRKERPSGWTTAQNALSRTVSSTTTGTGVNAEWDSFVATPPVPAIPRRETILRVQELETTVTPHGAENGPRQSRRAESAPQSPPPSALPSQSTDVAQGHDNINTPDNELLTQSYLATQLRLVLARYKARHRFRPHEPPPKSFVELASWLSERRPAIVPPLEFGLRA